MKRRNNIIMLIALLVTFCACGSKNGLEAKRLCLVRHRQDGPVSLIMVQCRKGAKPGLVWQEECLHHADGTPTDYYNLLYGG